EEPARLAGVVQGEDMGMGEARRDLNLAQEALGTEGGRQLGTEHLDCDGAAVLQVLGQIDRRRAPVAELPVDRVPIGQSAAQAGRQLSHRNPIPRSSGDQPHLLEEAAEPGIGAQAVEGGRSEEHTSELQSLAYLVCRLLLEKKKKKK